MGKPLNFTKAKVLEAIKNSGSVVSVVSKRLKVSWHTADQYIKKWPETIQAMKDEEQTILDLCESTIYKSVQNGDTQSAKWILATKGKRRGFSEKIEQEISGPGGTPLTPSKIEIVLVKPDAKPEA